MGNDLTKKQESIIKELNELISEIEQVTGKSSLLHLDALEFENRLIWYFNNRVMEEAK